MRAVTEASVEAGRGIVGDRYYNGNGTFSGKFQGEHDQELTLIEAEEIDCFNSANDFNFGYGDLRRNVVTRGIRLNDLVGKAFTVGEITLEGIRLCEPCKHLAGLVTPEILSDMVHRAGIRARIVTSGNIVTEDSVSVVG